MEVRMVTVFGVGCLHDDSRQSRYNCQASDPDMIHGSTRESGMLPQFTR